MIELLKKEESDGNVVLPRVILADCKDEKSLSEMCRQAKILINCVGPVKKHFIYFSHSAA